jgi:chitin disaccharide deacetylase
MSMSGAESGSVTAKLRRLGYGPDARLLIVHADDLGMCHSENAATFDAIEEGIATSTSMLVPCPWAYAAARHVATHPELDVGVEVAFTSEWQAYRWKPVLGAARCPSLVDDAGFLPRTVAEFLQRADPDQVRQEAEAQIELAMEWGVKPTHLLGHMGWYREPGYHELAVDLARKYRLPLRTRLARGTDGPDPLGEVLTADTYLGASLDADALGGLAGKFASDLRDLRPGVTEMILHVGLPTPELQAITPDWRLRAAAYEAVRHADAVRHLLEEQGVTLIGWRPLLEAQRANA